MLFHNAIIMIENLDQIKRNKYGINRDQWESQPVAADPTQEQNQKEEGY